jgi:hypothetical protein
MPMQIVITAECLESHASLEREGHNKRRPWSRIVGTVGRHVPTHARTPGKEKKP